MYLSLLIFFTKPHVCLLLVDWHGLKVQRWEVTKQNFQLGYLYFTWVFILLTTSDFSSLYFKTNILHFQIRLATFNTIEGCYFKPRPNIKPIWAWTVMHEKQFYLCINHQEMSHKNRWKAQNVYHTQGLKRVERQRKRKTPTRCFFSSLVFLDVHTLRLCRCHTKVVIPYRIYQADHATICSPCHNHWQTGSHILSATEMCFTKIK